MAPKSNPGRRPLLSDRHLKVYKGDRRARASIACFELVFALTQWLGHLTNNSPTVSWFLKQCEPQIKTGVGSLEKPSIQFLKSSEVIQSDDQALKAKASTSTPKSSKPGLPPFNYGMAIDLDLEFTPDEIANMFIPPASLPSL